MSDDADHVRDKTQDDDIGASVDDEQPAASDPLDDSVQEHREDEEPLDNGSDEPEYDVEAILRHKRMDGVLQFFIKWKDYSEEHNSWEPIDNVYAGALSGSLVAMYLANKRSEDLAEEYLSSNGIDRNGRKLTRAKKSSEPTTKKAATSQKKRPTSPELLSDMDVKSRKKYKGVSSSLGKDSDTNGGGGGGDDHELGALDHLSGSWEPHVSHVTSLERDEKTNQLMVHLVLSDQHMNATVVYSSRKVRKKCPQTGNIYRSTTDFNIAFHLDCSDKNNYHKTITYSTDHPVTSTCREITPASADTDENGAMDGLSQRGSMYDLQTLADDGNDEDWLYAPKVKSQTQQNPQMGLSQLRDEINVREWLREEEVLSELEESINENLPLSMESKLNTINESPDNSISAKTIHSSKADKIPDSTTITIDKKSYPLSSPSIPRVTSHKNSFFHPVPQDMNLSQRASVRLSHLLVGSGITEDLLNIQMDLRPISITDLKVDLDVMQRKDKSEKNRRAIMFDRGQQRDISDDIAQGEKHIHVQKQNQRIEDDLEKSPSPMSGESDSILMDVMKAYAAVESPIPLPGFKSPSRRSSISSNHGNNNDTESHTTTSRSTEQTIHNNLTSPLVSPMRRTSLTPSATSSQTSGNSHESAISVVTSNGGRGTSRLPLPARSGPHLPRSASASAFSGGTYPRQQSGDRLPLPSSIIVPPMLQSSITKSITSPSRVGSLSNSTTPRHQVFKASGTAGVHSSPALLGSASSLSSLTPSTSRSRSPLPLPTSPSSQSQRDTRTGGLLRSRTPLYDSNIFQVPSSNIAQPNSPSRIASTSSFATPDSYLRTDDNTATRTRPKTPISSHASRPSPLISQTNIHTTHPSSRSPSHTKSSAIPTSSPGIAPGSSMARPKSPMPNSSVARRQRSLSNTSSVFPTSASPGSSGGSAIPRPKTATGISSSMSMSALPLPYSQSQSDIAVSSVHPTSPSSNNHSSLLPERLPGNR